MHLSTVYLFAKARTVSAAMASDIICKFWTKFFSQLSGVSNEHNLFSAGYT